MRKKNYEKTVFDFDALDSADTEKELSAVKDIIKKVAENHHENPTNEEIEQSIPDLPPLSDEAEAAAAKAEATAEKVLGKDIPATLADSEEADYDDYDSLPDGQSAIDDDIKKFIGGKAFLNADSCKNPLIVQCLYYSNALPPEPLPEGIVQDINYWGDNEQIVDLYKAEETSGELKHFLANLLFAKNIRSIYSTTLKMQMSWMKACAFDDVLDEAISIFKKALDDYDPEYVNAVGARTKFNTFLTRYITNEIRKLHSKVKNRLSREEALDVPLDPGAADYNAKTKIEALADTRETPHDAAMRASGKGDIYKLFKTLTCMERFVTVLTCGLTEDRTSRTQAQIGELSGRTQADISKLWTSAVAKMRTACEEDPDLMQTLQDVVANSKA